jgi:hypothetical protein
MRDRARLIAPRMICITTKWYLAAHKDGFFRNPPTAKWSHRNAEYGRVVRSKQARYPILSARDSLRKTDIMRQGGIGSHKEIHRLTRRAMMRTVPSISIVI